MTTQPTHKVYNGVTGKILLQGSKSECNKYVTLGNGLKSRYYIVYEINTITPAGN